MTENTKEIKYVIWDNDNTLVPTAENHFHKHVSVAGKYGVDLNDTHRLRIAANNGRQNWEWLSKEMGLNVPLETYLEEIDLVFMECAKNTPLKPGIAESLDLLKDHKIPQCIMSNSRVNSLNISVKTHRFEKYMTLIWGKEDYEGRKNTPSPYFQIKTALEKKFNDSIDMSSIIFFDDDPACIEAAYDTGIKAVHIGDGPDPQKPERGFKNLDTTSEISALLQELI